MDTEALRKIHLFQGLGEADLERIGAVVQAQVLKQGQVLFDKGDPGDTVYFIESGQVDVFDPAESNLAVRTFQDGQMFGELAVIDRQPRTLSARAERDCRRMEYSIHSTPPFCCSGQGRLRSFAGFAQAALSPQAQSVAHHPKQRQSVS